MPMAEMEPLTSGASNRIIPIFRALRSFILFLHALLFSLVLFNRPRIAAASDSSSASSAKRRWREEEDVMRRRELANRVDMTCGGGNWCKWNTSVFLGVRRNTLFYRSWFPITSELRGVVVVMHGLNEHGGRYGEFAKKLTSCDIGVHAMDWIGHGGSDGLHGYVPNLDHVVADLVAFLDKIKSENPSVPIFLFGHSTGGAVVLKASILPQVRAAVSGVVLTSPALRVQPAHPIVGAVAPIISLLAPKFQFKLANKRGIAVSRDPAALAAKYSDPLVYTGPLRVRTGYEILRICSFLVRSFSLVTMPFFVLHGTADKVTDPLASQELYNQSNSEIKHIKLYQGFLHDLLFEPEKDDVARDITSWILSRLND